MYQDEILNCIDCGKDFLFTAREQEKGCTNKPIRCKSCSFAKIEQLTEEIASRGTSIF
jgi:DNA-directed RNA polymerase subunit RPC12/RpoP